MSPALFSLFLATLAIGTSEFIVAGILPNIAGDLDVSIPTAGYLISGYAIGVAIGGPIVALLTGHLERRATLLVLLGGFTVGSAFCALAPTYGWLMAARLLLSIGHGTYFGIALVVAASLVRPERHAGAVALVISGINVANIIGVPIGVWIGNALGWRATFWAIAALGAVAVAALARWVPRSAPAHGGLAGLGHQFRMLKKQEVWLSFAMIFCTTIGFFVVFSYIAPTLLYVTHISPTALPWVLALLGVGSLLGIVAGGRVPERLQMQSVIVVFACQILINAVLLAALPAFLPATVTLFLWSVANFAFSAPLQSRILRGAREAPNLSASLISSAFNVAISLGSALGAVSLTAGLSYGRLPLLAALASVPALALALVGWTIDRRRAPVAVAPGKA